MRRVLANEKGARSTAAPNQSSPAHCPSTAAVERVHRHHVRSEPEEQQRQWICQRSTARPTTSTSRSRSGLLGRGEHQVSFDNDNHVVTRNYSGIANYAKQADNQESGITFIQTLAAFYDGAKI